MKNIFCFLLFFFFSSKPFLRFNSEPLILLRVFYSGHESLLRFLQRSTSNCLKQSFLPIIHSLHCCKSYPLLLKPSFRFLFYFLFLLHFRSRLVLSSFSSTISLLPFSIQFATLVSTFLIRLLFFFPPSTFSSRKPSSGKRWISLNIVWPICKLPSTHIDVQRRLEIDL